MLKEPNKKAIGLFVLLGIGSFLLILLSILGHKLWTNNDDLIVMYFDESVNGLSVGSPVMFKGVVVGKVTQISLISTGARDLSFSIPVYVRFNTHQILNNADNAYYYKEDILNVFVKKGLRARLVSQNLLTGQLNIELEMLPLTPIRYRQPAGQPDILEIPTVLSSMGEISQGLQNLPIRETLQKMNDILDKLDNTLPIILPNLTRASGTLNSTLEEVGAAAKSLRNFADYVERHPEAFIKGKGTY